MAFHGFSTAFVELLGPKHSRQVAVGPYPTAPGCSWAVAWVDSVRKSRCRWRRETAGGRQRCQRGPIAGGEALAASHWSSSQAFEAKTERMSMDELGISRSLGPLKRALTARCAERHDAQQP